MPTATRIAATYKLYPSRAQLIALDRLHELHRTLYNAALEERIEAYKKGVSLSFFDQCKSLTIIRRQDPAYLAVNAQSAQVTLKRLDLAFRAFYRRCQAGKTPGFPRFKSRERFRGFGFTTHGTGFRFTPREGWKHGKLRLSGVGVMIARGEARTPGRIVCATIYKKVDRWYASVVLDCEPHRECGDREAGLDWGVETLATLAYGPGDYAHFVNERHAEQASIGTIQKMLPATARRSPSRRAKLIRLRIAKQCQRLANKRRDRNHKITARLVRDHKLIVTEKLAIANMTASARGTMEEPGKNIKAKAGLNRAILDATPGTIMRMLAAKAEEAGCELVVLNPRKIKPSQTCPSCGRRHKKSLSERKHECVCGFAATRDQAAALALLAAGLRLAGREPAWVRTCTPEAVASRATAFHSITLNGS